MPAGSRFALLAVGIATIPMWESSDYRLHLWITIWFVSIGALGVRLLLVTGIWSFGQGIFLTIGAYVSALAVVDGGVTFWLALPAAGVAAGLAAGAIGYPALRARGVYFAILTMSLVFVARQIIILTPDTTGGSAGFTGVPLPDPIGIGSIQVEFASRTALYYLGAALFLASFGVMSAIERSPLARILGAIKQEESLAASVGVDVRRYKVLAFVIAGSVSGIAGAFSAHYLSTAHPDVWGLWPSIFLVTYAIIGGVGSVFGPLIGVAVGVFALEFLAPTEGLRVLLLGAGLIAVMLVAPNGIIGLAALIRERWVQTITVRAGMNDTHPAAASAAVEEEPALVGKRQRDVPAE